MSKEDATPTTVLMTNMPSPRQRRRPAEAECDFYTSPTILSRLILRQKYDAAIRRIRKAPRETSTWVSSSRLIEERAAPDDCSEGSPTSVTDSQREEKQKKGRVECSYRQLPIHMACGALSLVVDTTLRAQVEDLIGRLVLAYPEGCTKRDHQERLPLHEALWQNASPDTIGTLLMAYPEGVDEKDFFGRSPMELNQHRRGECKEEVTQMLLRGKNFWAFARREANFKLKHVKVPTSGASVGSTSVLLDSLADHDDYTLASRGTVVPGRISKPVLKNPGESPMAWEQLEERAILLEKLLEERHEENYTMAEEISRLKEVETKYQHVTSSKHLAQSLLKLEKDKAEMQKQIHRMKTVLQRNDIMLDEDASVSTKPLEVTVELARSSGSRASSRRSRSTVGSLSTISDNESGMIHTKESKGASKESEKQPSRNDKGKSTVGSLSTISDNESGMIHTKESKGASKESEKQPSRNDKEKHAKEPKSPQKESEKRAKEPKSPSKESEKRAKEPKSSSKDKEKHAKEPKSPSKESEKHGKEPKSSSKEIEKRVKEPKSPSKESEKRAKEPKSPSKESEKRAKELKSPSKEIEKRVNEPKSPSKESEKRANEPKSPSKESEKRANESKSPSKESEKHAKEPKSPSKESEKHSGLKEKEKHAKESHPVREDRKQLESSGEKARLRLVKEQEEIDRLREERAYLQSLIDQLGKSGTQKKSKTSGSYRARRNLGRDKDKVAASKNSFIRKSLSVENGLSNVFKGPASLDAPNDGTLWESSQSSAGSSGEVQWHPLLQARQVFDSSEFEFSSNYSMGPILGGELTSIKEDASECSSGKLSQQSPQPQRKPVTLSYVFSR
jgi:hypothetical protein